MSGSGVRPGRPPGRQPLEGSDNPEQRDHTTDDVRHVHIDPSVQLGLAGDVDGTQRRQRQGRAQRREPRRGSDCDGPGETECNQLGCPHAKGPEGRAISYIRRALTGEGLGQQEGGHDTHKGGQEAEAGHLHAEARLEAEVNSIVWVETT